MTKASGFKYTQNQAQSVIHLVQGLNHGAVADLKHIKPLAKFSPVVALATVDGITYATVGFATGKVLDVPCDTIWPEWPDCGVIHGVNWIPTVYQLPAGMFDLGRHNLPLDTVVNITSWVLAQQKQSIK